MLLRLFLKLHLTFIFHGLNVIFWKLASHSKPSMEISVDNDAVKSIVKASFNFYILGLNLVFRKQVSHSKPSMEILVDDDAVKIIVKASFYFYFRRVKCGIPEVSQSF